MRTLFFMTCIVKLVWRVDYYPKAMIFTTHKKIYDILFCEKWESNVMRRIGAGETQTYTGEIKIKKGTGKRVTKRHTICRENRVDEEKRCNSRSLYIWEKDIRNNWNCHTIGLLCTQEVMYGTEPHRKGSCIAATAACVEHWILSHP